MTGGQRVADDRGILRQCLSTLVASNEMMLILEVSRNWALVSLFEDTCDPVTKSLGL